MLFRRRLATARSLDDRRCQAEGRGYLRQLTGAVVPSSIDVFGRHGATQNEVIDFARARNGARVTSRR